MKCNKVKNPMPTPGGAFETRWNWGACLPAAGFIIPELNLDLARNRCQREPQTRYSSYGQKEQDKTGTDKTNKTCTKKTYTNKTKRASENNGGGLARERVTPSFSEGVNGVNRLATKGEK